MKTDIHPKYHNNIIITCGCGNSIIAGSTKAEIKTEICSACHPFYTGQQKLVDTAGRVDKFRAKIKKAEELKSKSQNKADKEMDKTFEAKVNRAIKEKKEKAEAKAAEKKAKRETKKADSPASAKTPAKKE